MKYNCLTMLTMIGILLIVPTTMELWPPMLAFGQTATDGGSALSSGMNFTTATGNNNTSEKFLFIQSAQSGSISEVNATTSTLELSDVSDKTIMFSDRPDRIVSAANTAAFIDNWSMGPDSFAIDPPNAVLVLDDEKQKQELGIVDLYNPIYNPEAKTLKYDITADNATKPIDLPGIFGQSTLVIDPGNDNGPNTVNGNGAGQNFNNAGTSGDQPPQV